MVAPEHRPPRSAIHDLHHLHQTDPTRRRSPRHRDRAETASRTGRSVRIQRRTITPSESQQLLNYCDPRFAAAIGLCYVQGWRVSEALGLAWQDIDLDARTVRLRRGSTYADGIGMMLGPTKTQRTAGMQSLSRTVTNLLRQRPEIQDDDRSKLVDDWPTTTYDGEQLDLVFTTAVGAPMLRQHVDRAIRKAAARSGLDSAGLGTHAGRRSVVTNLFASALGHWGRTRPRA